ncbi:MAG: TetR family transcriptional regulator [Hydrogenophaga sp.]|uniref:TetR/AcrR family transcriptional regulator n=1 Tax=Hydrogenophaga sp. TaxID=1904254 RepID=UPI001DB0EF15|nr:TetR/AcrR family transcriptional regulator [Hydrogenophaga sp.]MBX3608937.1 TetR family transcriptional regulator [Hydrogenophaga sp.]
MYDESHPERAPEMRNGRQQSILQAAERLFADHGFHAVTLRQIADAADVPLALVGYYFGRKNDLFQAIFRHRRHWHLERLNAIDEARRQVNRKEGLVRLVEAFVLPLLRLKQGGETRPYARLLAREILIGSNAPDHPLREGFDPLVQRFMDALHVLHPQATSNGLAWASQFTLGAVALHLRDEHIERMSQGRVRHGDSSAPERLVRYLVGGLQHTLAMQRDAAAPQQTA